jgi:ClpP class serine protease
MLNDPTFQKVIASNDYQIHRKPLIENLQKLLNAKVITYIAGMHHPVPMIVSQDILPFEDLLKSAGGDEGYLILNSPGGDGNIAEKIITMCRQRFTKSFKVIVPNFAKSAATMIALGSDKILMGYLAELGPIDPQLGNPMGGLIPARSFIDGLEMIRHNIKDKGDPVQMYLPMLNQIRPEIIAQCQSAIDGSREFAEKWLKECMLREDPGQAKQVADWLSSGVKYKSHGKVINYAEAHDVLKLKVEKIPLESELWGGIWELYCRSVLFLQGQGPHAAKLFENERVSLTMSVQVHLVQEQRQPLPIRLPPQLQPQPRPQPQPQQPPPTSPAPTSPPESQPQPSPQPTSPAAQPSQ